MIKNSWQPLFAEGAEKDKILSLVHHISSELLATEEPESPSLLMGKAGISVFWEYLFLLNPNHVYRKNCLRLLDSSLRSIAEVPLSYSFCNGISGILWSFSHLAQSGASQTNVKDLIGDDIHAFLIDNSKFDLRQGNYDYLHGGGGTVLYFLNRLDDELARNGLEEIIRELKNSAFEFDEGVAWPDLNNPKKSFGYNLGLSHGISSIITLLARALQNNIAPETAGRLLEKSIEWLLDKKRNYNSFSLFPNILSLDPGKQSRLAWCYGDLGIAISLLQAAQITNNSKWENAAIEIALHASRRRDLRQNEVVDAGLCHGTTGIAHVFNRLFHYTGVEEFQTTAQYWYLKTFDLFDSDAGLRAWRRRTEYDNPEYVKDSGLLEGLSGIGLSLIASINDVEPNWDRCLLLS